MNIIEMQPAVLSSTFPISGARPAPSAPYLVHDHRTSPYAESRQSSKENKTPPLPEKQYNRIPISSPTVKGLEAVGSGAIPLKESLSPQSAVAGKKRLASGHVKEIDNTGSVKLDHSRSAHSRNTSSVSNASNETIVGARPASQPVGCDVDVSQLSQQLRTRLTYAMIKVQNGWQDRSLEEVESLASASPRSTTFNHYSNNAHLLSPRAAITAHIDQQISDASTVSTASPPRQMRPPPQLMSPPTNRKGLAPPANIISRPSQQRRRPASMQVQVDKSPQQPLSSRPTLSQRTPSQNAVLEADAVETLLFMASPNNSGKQSSQFSPVTSTPSVHQFPSQRSPLRSSFSAPVSPKRVAFTPNTVYDTRYGRDKETIVDSMLGKMDKESDAELEEALMHIDRYHATKLTI